jgi:hypothetical protein
MVKSCFTLSLAFLRPSSDRGKVLLEGNLNLDANLNLTELFWYDLKSEQVTYLEIPSLKEVMIYVESLVPPSLTY